MRRRSALPPALRRAALPWAVRAVGLCLLALAGALAPPHRADAQVYVWTDPHGGLHFTDSPRSLEYRLYEPGGSRPTVRSNRRYDAIIARAGARNRVSPALVKAVVHAESNFDRRAISRKGARGLMQLMPRTARSLGVSDPFDARQNIYAGSRYLRELIGRYSGNLRLALAAYNAGPGAVGRHSGVPPYRETRGYVRRVLTLYRRYDADFR
ncbi:MAG: transglycosylase SLT domain-containing protein [Myxococcota bacterium]